MNTSGVSSQGSRPLLPSASSTYSQQPKDVLFLRLLAQLSSTAWIQPTTYETYLYEFPGDRTTEKYLRNKSGVQ